MRKISGLAVPCLFLKYMRMRICYGDLRVKLMYHTYVLMFLTITENVAEGFIAGGTAGVVVETALYPIDTIKTRLQAV